jgi:small GTP-binding protein
MSSRQVDLKIVVLGASNVGKTALISRYCKGAFSEDTIPTLGADFLSHPIELPEADVTVMFWDTAGQERFHAITPSYLNGANGLILVFDISAGESFAGIDIFFNMFLDKYGARADPPPVLLLGNKCDLPSQEVTEDAIARWCEEHRVLRYWAVSAKTNTNIDGAMTEFIQSLVEITADVEPVVVPIALESKPKPCC